MLEVKNLTVAYGSRTVVRDLSFSVEPGQWLMLIGPNGSGKSTTLNAITQGVAYTGTVLCHGRDVRTMKSVERAREIGFLAQNHHMGYAFTVEEVVELGRYAHSPGLLSGKRPEDRAAVEAALAITGMEGLRRQSVLTLSGGELQRTFLAQVLCQEPKLLLLDEPTNHLDLIYQKQIFSLISDWLQTPGRAVVSVVHDLSLARAYGTHGVLLDEGVCQEQGPASQVFTPETLNRVYRMDVAQWMKTLLSQWTADAP